jgi:glycosyltransferase involved in cell wall biosynthesis
VRVDSPLVSVVTPVFNGERFLAECIESVLAQSYERWEYVVVDNQSTDRTLEIARSYAERDPRIRVSHNERFLEIIPNWNNALRQISRESTYCKVVHADDLLFPECLEKLVAVAEANPRVGVVGSYQLRGSDVQLDGVVPFPEQVVGGKAICRTALTGGGSAFGTPTTILVRADLVRSRERFYNEDNLHADTEACFEALRTTDFGFVHQILSHTRAHDAAMTHTAVELNSFIAGRIGVLLRHGRTYLDTREYERRLARQTLRYGAFLARAAVRGKLADSRFRELHGRTLGSLRENVSARELVRGLGTDLAEVAGRLVVTEPAPSKPAERPGRARHPARAPARRETDWNPPRPREGARP